MTLKSVLRFPLEIVSWLVAGFPGRGGVFLRRTLYTLIMRSGRSFDLLAGVEILGLSNLAIGDGTCIEARCTLLCSGAPMTIGKNCYLNKNVRLGSGGDASFVMGDHVMVGPNVVMDTSAHGTDSVEMPMKKQAMSYAPITIEDDVWIGANVVITSGVLIGQGSIVGAGAVVTRDVAPFTVVGGIPARRIGHRKEGKR